MEKKVAVILAFAALTILLVGVFEVGIIYANNNYPIKTDGKFHAIKCSSGYELAYQIFPMKGFYLWFEGKPIHNSEANLTSYDTYGIIVGTYDSGRTHQIAVVCP